jgi:hypothetical protein
MNSNEQPFTQPQQATKRKEEMKKLLKAELLNGNTSISPNVENGSAGSAENCSGSIGDSSTGMH